MGRAQTVPHLPQLLFVVRSVHWSPQQACFAPCSHSTPPHIGGGGGGGELASAGIMWRLAQLPASHLVPPQPFGQVHVKLFTLSAQVPPCWQGLAAHSLMSVSQFLPE